MKEVRGSTKHLEEAIEDLMTAVFIGFRDKGIEAAKIAVAEDAAGNYEKALNSYRLALDFFQAYLKYEKNPKAREAITEKASQGWKASKKEFTTGYCISPLSSSPNPGVIFILFLMLCIVAWSA